MEFQSIEYTKCCHRLYDLLKRSTILELTGEPWVRIKDDNLYFCSDTSIGQVISISVLSSTNESNLLLSNFLLEPVFLPLKEFMIKIRLDEKYRAFSLQQKNQGLCKELGDFFRIHYQKFN